MIKSLIAVILIAAIAIFGYYAYQNFRKNPIDTSNIKGTIEQNIDNTKKDIESAKQDAIDSAKNSAADALKDKVDEALGTK